MGKEIRKWIEIGVLLIVWLIFCWGVIPDGHWHLVKWLATFLFLVAAIIMPTTQQAIEAVAGWVQSATSWIWGGVKKQPENILWAFIAVLCVSLFIGLSGHSVSEYYTVLLSFPKIRESYSSSDMPTRTMYAFFVTAVVIGAGVYVARPKRITSALILLMILYGALGQLPNHGSLENASATYVVAKTDQLTAAIDYKGVVAKGEAEAIAHRQLGQVKSPTSCYSEDGLPVVSLPQFTQVRIAKADVPEAIRHHFGDGNVALVKLADINGEWTDASVSCWVDGNLVLHTGREQALPEVDPHQPKTWILNLKPGEMRTFQPHYIDGHWAKWSAEGRDNRPYLYQVYGQEAHDWSRSRGEARFAVNATVTYTGGPDGNSFLVTEYN